MRHLGGFLLLALLAPILGIAEEPPVCPATYVYAVTLALVDGQGSPINGAELVLQDGRYLEKMRPFDEHLPESERVGIYQGGGERAGTYRVKIHVNGKPPIEAGPFHIAPAHCSIEGISRTITIE